MTKTIKVSESIDKNIYKAAEVIKKGGIVVFPTSRLYGLAADPFNSKVVESIFKLKKRENDKALSLLIPDIKNLYNLACDPGPEIMSIIEHVWPGKVTMIFKAADAFGQISIENNNEKKYLDKKIYGRGGTIGLRIPMHKTALALVEAVNGPITATSANISGRQGCCKIEDLDSRIADGADLILDAGALPGGMGSTIIDVSKKPFSIIRQGDFYLADIFFK